MLFARAVLLASATLRTPIRTAAPCMGATLGSLGRWVTVRDEEGCTVPEETAEPKLDVVTDKHFAELQRSPQPKIIDFAADYCGPCNMAEPALVRLNAKPGISVVKATASGNPMLRTWLLTHGVRITALPTLVLLRDGKPVRSMMGATNILKESSLHAFAFDEVSAHDVGQRAPAEAMQQTSGQRCVGGACAVARPRDEGGFFSKLGSILAL